MSGLDGVRHSNKNVNIVTLSEAKDLARVEWLKFRTGLCAALLAFAVLRMANSKISGIVRAPE